jgi:hypothetical protein
MLPFLGYGLAGLGHLDGAKRGYFRKRRSAVNHKHPRSKDPTASAVERLFQPYRNDLPDRVARKHIEGHEKNPLEPCRSEGPSSFGIPQIRDRFFEAKTPDGQGPEFQP